MAKVNNSPIGSHLESFSGTATGAKPTRSFFRRKRFWISLISAVVLIPVFLLTPYLLEAAESQESKPGDPLTAEEISLLQPGDIILRKGNSFVSSLIEDTLGEPVPLSHVALIVQRPEGLGVIHSISSNLSGIDGVQYQALNQFVRHSDPASTIVLRPDLNIQQLTQLLEKGESFLAEEVPFDHSFDLSDEEELYCSELLTVLLEDVQFWTEQHPVITHAFGWVAFETFWGNPGFQVILDHTGLMEILRQGVN